jgi:hypothetical protein
MIDEPGTSGRGEALAKLLACLGIAGHVLFHDVLPAALTWVLGSADLLNLFAAFETPALRRVTELGLFLSAVAAIITTESVTRMARPFGVGAFLTTVVATGLALFPSLAEAHRVALPLTPEQFAVLQSYCYLALRVIVGILVGATVSWVLLAGYVPLAPVRRLQPTRK